MRQYIYGRENLSIVAYVVVIICLLLLILGISIIVIDEDIAFVGYSVLGTFVICLIILLCVIVRVLKWRKWHNKIISLGKKVKGKVIGVYSFKSPGGQMDLDIPSHKEYFFRVMYQDNQVEKIFDTPSLSFRPEERSDVTCDVYIYNNNALATNFINLNKEKINRKELFFSLIVVSIIVLIACFAVFS